MIGSSDEDAELTDEDFKTPPTKTPLRGLPKLETRGRHPKDPVPRLRKKEENKLRGESRKLRAEKEKAEEREHLLVDLGELIRGGGIWEEVRTPTRAPPPAVNLPLVEVETQMAEKDSAVVAEALARHAEVVDGIAYVATNLTGVAKRQLRLAALVVKAGIKTLSGRMGGFAVSPDQREMEALTRKVERLEKEGQEKDRRIVELEQRCDELRDLATMEMSLDCFRRDRDDSPPAKEKELEKSQAGGDPGGREKPPATQGSSPTLALPGWLPTSRRAFDVHVGKIVLW